MKYLLLNEKGGGKDKKWNGPPKDKICKQPTRWFQKSFKCDKFLKRCDKNDPEMVIPQCACQLVWARGTKDSKEDSMH